MGVIYIGDRFAGKTHLALELANPQNKHVKVAYPDYEDLKARLMGDEPDSTMPTAMVSDNGLEIQVRLPAGTKEVDVTWIDTPGEIWRSYWQERNPDQWQKFIDNSRKSQGILLILSPYREMLLPAIQADNEVAALYPNQEQWCNRFERWVEFFTEQCPNARHIAICLNKADLFISNLERDAGELAFNPNGSSMTWKARHERVLSRHFQPIQSQLMQINRGRRGLSVRCFMTTIYNRPLLELPWIYLASFLEQV